MIYKLACGIVLGLAVTTATAQDWAQLRLEESPRHLEWVKVNAEDREVDCFLAFPEVSEPATAVVVIHEIFGLSDWIRSVTDQLAAEGYIAIAPDLLSQMAPDGGGTQALGTGDAARQAIASLPPDQITSDLKHVVDHVRALPACNGKVAVIGFCWGGSQTFRFATNHPEIIAAMPFYGSGPDSEEAIARIVCPVFGFYGEMDARVNATLPRTKELMLQAGKKFEPEIYPGAGHGFMRTGEAPDADDANRAGRDAAWKRLKRLLDSRGTVNRSN